MYPYKPLRALVAIGVLALSGTLSADALPVQASDNSLQSMVQVSQARENRHVAGVSFSLGIGGGGGRCRSHRRRQILAIRRRGLHLQLQNPRRADSRRGSCSMVSEARWHSNILGVFLHTRRLPLRWHSPSKNRELIGKRLTLAEAYTKP